MSLEISFFDHDGEEALADLKALDSTQLQRVALWWLKRLQRNVALGKPPGYQQIVTCPQSSYLLAADVLVPTSGEGAGRPDAGLQLASQAHAVATSCLLLLSRQLRVDPGDVCPELALERLPGFKPGAVCLTGRKDLPLPLHRRLLRCSRGPS